MKTLKSNQIANKTVSSHSDEGKSKDDIIPHSITERLANDRINDLYTEEILDVPEDFDLFNLFKIFKP